MAHGAGGRMTQRLVRDVFLPALANPFLEGLSDAAVLPELPPGRPAFTTDGFVVDPPVFPGGDLGYLSVCGTVNDLSVAGARPLWLAWALILEEGADAGFVRLCVEGAARAAKEAGVSIVAGDTKVVPKGKGDGLYVATSGLGVVPPGREASDGRIAAGDVLLVSGPVGDHGATIMACRHGLSGTDLRSDCAPLASLAEALYGLGPAVKVLHDPTRGGVLTTCHEVAGRTGLRIVLDEASFPVRDEVRAVCSLLGLSAWSLPCEGRALAWVAGDSAEAALARLRSHPQGAGAEIIGRTEAARPGAAPVAIRTLTGEERPLDLLSGAELPRIC